MEAFVLISYENYYTKVHKKVLQDVGVTAKYTYRGSGKKFGKGWSPLGMAHLNQLRNHVLEDRKSQKADIMESWYLNQAKFTDDGKLRVDDEEIEIDNRKCKPYAEYADDLGLAL